MATGRDRGEARSAHRVLRVGTAIVLVRPRELLPIVSAPAPQLARGEDGASAGRVRRRRASRPTRAERPTVWGADHRRRRQGQTARPSCAARLSPQHATRPSLSRAHVVAPAALSWVTLGRPAIRVDRRRLRRTRVGTGVPSTPNASSPQQRTVPSLIRAQKWSLPATSCVAHGEPRADDGHVRGIVRPARIRPGLRRPPRVDASGVGASRRSRPSPRRRTGVGGRSVLVGDRRPKDARRTTALSIAPRPKRDALLRSDAPFAPPLSALVGSYRSAMPLPTTQTSFVP